MKKLMISALVAAQLLTAAQPAFAADLTDAGATHQQMGAFGGLRVRIPLDGNARQRQVRAGLTMAPMMQSRTVQGESRLRIGEGVEFGVRGGEPLALSLGGFVLTQRSQAGQDQPDDEPEQRERTPDERQLETGRKILKGAAVVALIGAAVVGGLFLFITVACDGNRCDE